jgi:hypothetical protein
MVNHHERTRILAFTSLTDNHTSSVPPKLSRQRYVQITKEACLPYTQLSTKASSILTRVIRTRQHRQLQTPQLGNPRLPPPANPHDQPPVRHRSLPVRNRLRPLRGPLQLHHETPRPPFALADVLAVWLGDSDDRVCWCQKLYAGYCAEGVDRGVRGGVFSRYVG